MTHLLPPNLLKLFAPRPPLPYTRPLDRDIDRVTPKKMGGMADILARVREENALGTGVGKKAAEEGITAMEEGEEVEEPFTLAEEYRRQLHREERKKRDLEEFQKAKTTCE